MGNPLLYPPLLKAKIKSAITASETKIKSATLLDFIAWGWGFSAFLPGLCRIFLAMSSFSILSYGTFAGFKYLSETTKPTGKV